VPQITLNIATAEASTVIAQDSVRAALTQIENTLHGRGRVVLRASGTEPLVRVTVEADEAGEVERLANFLADAVKSAQRPSA
jgi:phosphoglucosamine mutase